MHAQPIRNLFILAVFFTAPAFSQSAADICSEFPHKFHPQENLDGWLRLEPCLDAGSDSSQTLFRNHLKKSLPADARWYRERLTRFRAQRETPQALALARLAEIKNLGDGFLERELAQVYLHDSRFTAAGRAFLRQLAAQPDQAVPVQYQLDQLIRQASAWIPPEVLIDSLNDFFPSGPPVIHNALEILAWSSNHLPAAFENFRKRLQRDSLPWDEVETTLERFRHAGYLDYAVRLLESIDWNELTAKERKQALLAFHRLYFELKDYKSLLAHPSASQASAFSVEQQYILAHAHILEGDPNRAMPLLDKVEAAGEAPWKHRARLLRARALLRAEKPDQAMRLLEKEKASDLREESSGPLLFWQGIAALYQNRYPAADSLFILASAYTGGYEAQRALELRNWLMLDTSTVVRQAFFQGLEEGPLTVEKRLASLESVPSGSSLFPHATMERALRLLELERPDAALELLERLSRKGSNPLAVKAGALAAFVLEARLQAADKAVVKYRSLLLEYQQGVFPEFSRRRMRSLQESRGSL